MGIRFMEDTINIRPYIRSLLRNWWIIISATVGLGLIAWTISVTRTPSYTASASLLIVPSSVQLTLDNRFTNRNSLLFTTTVNQREALLGLARDATLEERVAQAMAMAYQPGELRGRIAIDANGDLLRITARADTSDDAQQLATAWAQEYVRLVTETYNRDTVSLALVEQQLADAQRRFREAQVRLEEFLAQGEIFSAEQRVRRLTDLVNTVRSTSTNQFADYLRRSNILEQILRDARLLRERLTNQASDGTDGNMADAIAALLLRIRNLSDQGSDRPILQIDSSLANDMTITAEELDQLIDVLEAEYRTVRKEAERLSSIEPEELSPAANQLLIERLIVAQTQYEQLLARQRELTRNRDVAFSLVEVLLRRVDELRVANAAPQVSMRYLGTVADPSPVIGRQVLTQVAVAALAGFVLAAAVIVVIEAISIDRRSHALQPKPSSD